MFLRYRVVLGNLPGEEEEFGFGERTSFYRAYIQFTEEFNCWVWRDIATYLLLYTTRSLSQSLSSRCSKGNVSFSTANIHRTF